MNSFEADAFRCGFFGELEKLSVAKHMANFMKSRAGRRPISAAKLLKKADLEPRFLDDGTGRGKKKPGDIPSREDVSDEPKREDGRSFWSVMPATNNTRNESGLAQSPERSS